MAKKISRRSFIKKTAAAGASTVIGGAIIPSAFKSKTGIAYGSAKVDVSVVKGENYFENAVKAVEQLGGMEKFVPKGSKVAVLANPQRNNPGAYTKPEVLRAVIKMCKDAGAKEVNCISQLAEGNWESTGLLKVVQEEGANYIYVDRQDESKFKSIPIGDDKVLKEAFIIEGFLANDVFINVPITKDHAGNKFTGTLKNLMGLNLGKSNRSFHKANWTKDVEAIKHLDHCIADLNLTVKPDLCVVDATEFITTNGPFGPGEIIKPMKVVAGVDRVAVDSYCATLLGLKGTDVVHIKKAFEYKLGEIDLNKVNIKEIEI
ncbi:DUF362 domain-containing protein [candidate division KSB1 bacterium]